MAHYIEATEMNDPAEQAGAMVMACGRSIRQAHRAEIGCLKIEFALTLHN
jgi:hypothetical protein